MIQNIIKFVFNANGSLIDKSTPSIKANTDLSNKILVVAPHANTTSVQAIYNPRATQKVFTQFMRITEMTGKDILDDSQQYFQLVQDWPVWEIEIFQNVLANISRYNSGVVGVSFKFGEYIQAVEGLEYKGTFGTSLYSTTKGDLPASATLGDYYVSDYYNFYSSNADLIFTFNEAAVWNGEKWVTGSTFNLTSLTATQTLAVEPSLIGLQLDEIDETVLNQVMAAASENSGNIVTLASEIDALQILPAVGIETIDITNWDTAYGWGDHSQEGYLTSYTETDPIYSAWDKSTGITITENQINDLQDYLVNGTSTTNIPEGTNLYYTDARADARVSLLIDSSPETLNTLNELAAALGDDPNFATTVASSLGNKVDKVSGYSLTKNDFTDNKLAEVNANTLKVSYTDSAAVALNTAKISFDSTSSTLVNSTSTKVTQIENKIIYKDVVQDTTDRYKFYLNSVDNSLYDHRILYAHLPEEILSDGNNPIQLSIDNGASYKLIANANGETTTLENSFQRGRKIIFVYESSDEKWYYVGTDQDFSILAGQGWNGETIKNNALNNMIQDTVIEDIINVISSGGSIISQKIENTIVTELTTTPTDLVFDTILRTSGDLDILELDVDGNHVLKDENVSGYRIRGNFTMVGTALATSVISTALLELYIDAVKVDEISFSAVKNQEINRIKEYDYVIPTGQSPKTLTVKATLTNGSMNLISGILAVETLWTTAGGAAAPATSYTVSLTNPTLESPDGDKIRLTDALQEMTTDIIANTAKISFDSTSSTKLGTIEEGAQVNDNVWTLLKSVTDWNPDVRQFILSTGDSGIQWSTNNLLTTAPFQTAGFMKADGDGTYSIDSSTYLTSETSHSDVLVDGDFASAGFMKTNGSGTYSIDSSTYLTSLPAHALTDHSDVTITTPSDNQFLRHNGTNWVNETVTIPTALTNTDGLTEGSTNLYYTDARADARIALLVDSSPTTLDTLNELAAALGDDPNFATTVSTALGNKADKLLTGISIVDGTISATKTVLEGLGYLEYRVNLNDAKISFDSTSSSLLASALQSETSHADVLVDGDFATAGLMTTDGSGDYSITATSTFAAAVHNHNLTGLNDVYTTGITDGQLLKWNSTLSRWQASDDNDTTPALNDVTDVTISTVATGNILQYNGSAWVNSTTLSGDYTFSGNTSFTGTTTYVNTTQLNVADNIMVLNYDVTATPTENSGIEVERGTETNKTFLWNETNDVWEADGNEIITVANNFAPITTESTTARTLALTDAGDFIKCTSASATTVTVPPNSSVAFVIGTEIIVTQYGAGAVTIAAGSGVTINALDTLVLAGQYASATLKKMGTDEWLLVGALTAA